jgi:hypothetical protein
MSSTQQVHPSSGIPSWLGPILQVLTLAQGIAGSLMLPVVPMVNLLAITSKTGNYVNSAVTSGTSTTSTAGTDSQQDDMVDLQYIQLSGNVKLTYVNMEKIAGNQVKANMRKLGKASGLHDACLRERSCAQRVGHRYLSC